MFIGHFAVAFAAKKISPKASLGTLFIAAQFIDLLWPILLLAGVEHVKIDPGNTLMTPLHFYDYPISHSLMAVFAWSIILSSIYYFTKRDTRISITLACLVLSHWLLDLVVHRPDLPIFLQGGPYIGLGLWNSMTLTILIETSLFLFGFYIYLTRTEAKNRIGEYGLYSLALVLIVIYFANFFGPPPPSEKMIAVAANAMWIFVAWAYWIDKNRTMKILTNT